MAEIRAPFLPERALSFFLSHSDILLAFWYKTMLAAQHPRPGRPVHILNVMNSCSARKAGFEAADNPRRCKKWSSGFAIASR